MARLTGVMVGLRQVKITKLVAGVADDTFLVGCPQLLSFEENQTKIEIPGGDAVCETITIPKSLKMTLRFPKLDLEMIAAMTGATYAQSGTGSTIVDTYTRTTSDQAPYLIIEGRVINVGSALAGGEYYIKAYQAKIVGTPKWSNETEKDATIECELEATENSDGDWYELKLRVTAVPLT